MSSSNYGDHDSPPSKLKSSPPSYDQVVNIEAVPSVYETFPGSIFGTSKTVTFELATDSYPETIPIVGPSHLHTQYSFLIRDYFGCVQAEGTVDNLNPDLNTKLRDVRGNEILQFRKQVLSSVQPEHPPYAIQRVLAKLFQGKQGNSVHTFEAYRNGVRIGVVIFGHKEPPGTRLKIYLGNDNTELTVRSLNMGEFFFKYFNAMDQIVSELKTLNLDLNDKTTACHFDKCDLLKEYRSKFKIPQITDPLTNAKKNGVYLLGNSLGLQPKSALTYIEEELQKWEDYGVEAYFMGKNTWYEYDEKCTKQMAEIVGAKPAEVAVMASLTANLHFLMTAFYTPTPSRFKILMEDGAFPADAIAVRSHIKSRNLSPEETLILVKPREGEYLIRDEDILSQIKEHGNEIALVFIGGVNYFTGQVFDAAAITKLAHSFGCIVGFDFAHGAGNIKLKIHEWGPDFAVWCTYKYLNSGPGGIGCIFVHERHANDTSRSRLAGWWSHDRTTRFLMKPDLIPSPGALGYQISSPPVLCIATLKASLDIFSEVGLDALIAKSKRLTSYLQLLLTKMDTTNKVKIITPMDESKRGCQLSLIFSATSAKLILEALLNEGVFCDFREPNCIRVAPCPLYSTFADVYDFVSLLMTLINKYCEEQR